MPPCGTSPEPKVPRLRHVPGTQSAALRHVPGTLERSGRVSGVQRKDSARSALPSCLKAVTSRCAAHRCAGSRTRFRCAAPFRERAAWPHFRGVAQPCISPPHPRHPGRSAAESRDLSPTRIGSQSPHPEEQTRLGLRLEGRGWRWPRWFSLLESLVLRDAMRSRMAPQDEGFVLFDVDNIPISAILRSLFTQEGTLPERSVAGWGGGACAGGVPLRRPGRPPESGLAQRAKPVRGAKG